MSSQSQTEIILDLKKRAVALKESGDNNGAMALLAQARDLEFEGVTVDEVSEPLKLKQLAVVLKKKGNIEGAKQALLKAKQIEKGGAVQAAPPPPSDPQPEQQQPTEVTSSEPENQATKEEGKTESSQPPPAKMPEKEVSDIPQKTNQEPTISKDVEQTDDVVPAAQLEESEVHPEEEEELLSELQVQSDGRIFSAEDSEELERLMNEQTFSVEEMANHDMMTEFKLGGMPVPSDEDYQARIMECKKSALAFKKAGDTSSAMKELKQSKQLEAVRVALEQMNEGLGLRINDDQDGWIETLTDEESQLLGMSLAKKKTAGEGGGTGDTMLDILEELADFMEDPNMLMDAIDMGMQVPDAEEVQAEAQRQRQQAIDHKQAGDLEAAKIALAQSKKLAAHGAQIEKAFALMRRKAGSANEDSQEGVQQMSLEALEAMVDAEEKKAKDPVPAAEPKEEKPKHKSSQELRAEAVRLRDEKKVKEATEVLKLYKEALKREQQEADMKRRQDMVEELYQEIKLAKQHIRIFEYYQRFVSPDIQQISAWKDYISKCTSASRIVEGSGVEALQITRKTTSLLCARMTEDASFNDMMTDLVENATNPNPTDDRLEITIVDVRGLDENHNLEKLIKHHKRENTPRYPYAIRAHVAVQLPPNEQETDKATEFEFESAVFDPNDESNESNGNEGGSGNPQELRDCYDFENATHFINLPRNETDSYAKILRRRIERNKKIQITVYHVPKAMKKKGWLSSLVKPSKNDEEIPAPTLLGKVTLEMQALLSRRCLLVGEMDLMNGSGTKALGGTIGLGVRTGVPFSSEPKSEDDVAAAAPTSNTKLEKYEAMTFAMKKQEQEEPADTTPQS